MKCALFCIHKLSEYYSYPVEEVEKELTMNLGEYGIDLSTLIRICHSHNIVLKAYKSLFLLPHTPCILLLRPKRKGHYITLIKDNILSCTIEDERYGRCKISKLRLYLFWTHVSVLCYNEKRNEDTL